MKHDIFTKAYLECALWSTNDESDAYGGEPLDKNYSIKDISPTTLAKMVKDCEDFQSANYEAIKYNLKLAGHLFWLNRNGHGAGFWDNWPNKDGDKLSEASKKFNGFNLILGDDGKIHN